MRLVSWPLAALVSGVVLTGCGGSVADADAPTRTRTATAPASPFCAAVRANSDAIRPLNELTRTGGTARDLATTVETVRFTGIDLVSASPAELAADVRRTVDAVNLQLDALVAAGGDAAAAGRDPALVTALGAPELAAANRRVSAFVTENCTTVTR